MTFEDWLNELEIYSTRRERLIEGMMTYRDDTEYVIKWMRAAYNEGVKAASQHEPVPTPPYVQPTAPPTSCQRCGIKLGGAMGYVCTDKYCPTFMQITSKTTSATLLNENTNWD